MTARTEIEKIWGNIAIAANRLTEGMKPLEQIVMQVSRAVQPFQPELLKLLEGLDRVSRAVQPLQPALLKAQGGLERVVRAVQQPHFRQLVEGIGRAHALMETLPKGLKKALRKRGRSVHPELALRDIVGIIAEYEKGGEDAAVAEVDRLHEELLSSALFREEAAKRWEYSKKRAPMFAQLLNAHDQGMYFLTVPAALAHAEGLVVELVPGLVKPDKRLTDSKYKHLIQMALREDEFLGPVTVAFAMFLHEKTFRHGEPVPYFQRAAIVHGADVEYATKEISAQAIVWVDYLMYLQVEKERDKCMPKENESP